MGGEHTLHRRGFLVRVGLGAAAMLLPFGRPSFAQVPALDPTLVYKLSTNRRRCCRACKAHAANRFYRTRELADADRPHPGCNCGIVQRRVSAAEGLCYFASSDMYDRRWGTVAADGTYGPAIQAPVCGVVDGTATPAVDVRPPRLPRLPI